MTIREYAEDNNIEVVGKLRRIVPSTKIKNISVYVDDEGKEFWINRKVNVIQIFDKDGVY